MKKNGGEKKGREGAERQRGEEGTKRRKKRIIDASISSPDELQVKCEVDDTAISSLVLDELQRFLRFNDHKMNHAMATHVNIIINITGFAFMRKCRASTYAFSNIISLPAKVERVWP